MMAKAVGLHFGPVACTLLVLMSAHFPQTDRFALAFEICEDEVYLELVSKKFSVDQVEGRLEVAQQQGKIFIGDVRISKILLYRETSCKLDSLDNYRSYLSEVNVKCKRIESCISLLDFQRFYIEKRKQSCAERISPFLRSDLKRIEAKDQQILKDFHSNVQKAGPSDRNSIASQLGKKIPFKPIRGSNKDMEPFVSCVKLIKSLNTSVPYEKFLKLDSVHEFVELWSNIWSTCIIYLRSGCSELQTKKLFKLYAETRDCEEIDSVLQANYWLVSSAIKQLF